jgi:hypothetical protein
MTTPRRIVIPSVVTVACLVSYLAAIGNAGARPAPDDVLHPGAVVPSSTTSTDDRPHRFPDVDVRRDSRAVGRAGTRRDVR